MNVQSIVLTCVGVLWTIVQILFSIVLRANVSRENKQDERMQSHSNKLDDHERRITKTEADIKQNYQLDNTRQELLNEIFKRIEKDIEAVKEMIKESTSLARETDKRLTNYIIKKNEGQ